MRESSHTLVILPEEGHGVDDVLGIVRFVQGHRISTARVDRDDIVFGDFAVHTHVERSRLRLRGRRDFPRTLLAFIAERAVTQVCLTELVQERSRQLVRSLRLRDIRVVLWSRDGDSVGLLDEASALPDVVAANPDGVGAGRLPSQVAVAWVGEPLVPLVDHQGDRSPGPPRLLVLGPLDAGDVEFVRELAVTCGIGAEVHLIGAAAEVGCGTIDHGNVSERILADVIQAIRPDMVCVPPGRLDLLLTRARQAWSYRVPVLTADPLVKEDVVVGIETGIVTVHPHSLLCGVHASVGEEPPAAVWRSPLTAAEDLRTRALERSLEARPAVAVISKMHAASAIVRVGLVSRAAERAGHITVRHANVQDIVSGADTTRYSTILLQRHSAAAVECQQLLEHAERTGIRLVVELDDDLISEAAVERLVLHGGYKRDDLNMLRRACQAADALVVSTDPLARALEAVSGVRPTIFPNRLDPQLWTDPVDPVRVRRGIERVLYFGSATHGGDLELIADVPGRLSALLGREVRFDIVGVTTGSLPPGMDALRPGASRYPEFVRWLRKSRNRWSAGVAPLAADALNGSKSDLKLLEYAALGLPVVASRVGPYVRADDLAMLIDDGDLDGWVSAIAQILTDRDGARARVARARKVVFADRMLDADAVRRWAGVVLGEPCYEPEA